MNTQRNALFSRRLEEFRDANGNHALVHLKSMMREELTRGAETVNDRTVWNVDDAKQKADSILPFVLLDPIVDHRHAKPDHIAGVILDHLLREATWTNEDLAIMEEVDEDTILHSPIGAQRFLEGPWMREDSSFAITVSVPFLTDPHETSAIDLLRPKITDSLIIETETSREVGTWGTYTLMEITGVATLPVDHWAIHNWLSDFSLKKSRTAYECLSRYAYNTIKELAYELQREDEDVQEIFAQIQILLPDVFEDAHQYTNPSGLLSYVYDRLHDSITLYRQVQEIKEDQ